MPSPLSARLEVDQAVHPIATPVTGRFVATSLVVGRKVQAGEVLAELDAEAPRLQHEEASTRLTALTAQRQARQQEILAEEVARTDERQAARSPWPRPGRGIGKPTLWLRRQPSVPPCLPVCRSVVSGHSSIS